MILLVSLLFSTYVFSAGTIDPVQDEAQQVCETCQTVNFGGLPLSLTTSLGHYKLDSNDIKKALELAGCDPDKDKDKAQIDPSDNTKLILNCNCESCVDCGNSECIFHWRTGGVCQDELWNEIFNFNERFQNTIVMATQNPGFSSVLKLINANKIDEANLLIQELWGDYLRDQCTSTKATFPGEQVVNGCKEGTGELTSNSLTFKELYQGKYLVLNYRCECECIEGKTCEDEISGNESGSIPKTKIPRSSSDLIESLTVPPFSGKRER